MNNSVNALDPTGEGPLLEYLGVLGLGFGGGAAIVLTAGVPFLDFWFTAWCTGSVAQGVVAAGAAASAFATGATAIITTARGISLGSFQLAVVGSIIAVVGVRFFAAALCFGVAIDLALEVDS